MIMKKITLNDSQKELVAGKGKVLRNDEEWEEYPTRVVVNINDDSWFEIDTPNTEVIKSEPEN